MAQTDAATALRKLQSNQPLTDAEKKILGMSVTPTETPTKTVETLTTPVGQDDPSYYTVKVGSTGKTSAQLDAETNAAETARLTDGTVNTNTGMITPKSSTGLNTSSGMSADKVDAVAALGSLLSSYGIGGLTNAITAAVQKGYSADTIQLIMQDPNSTDPLAVAFQARFPANKARLAAGKSVLSPGEYLAAERSYAQVFQSYGLGNMAKPDNFNKFIAGDVSSAEVSDRVSLAVNRIQNADPFVKQALGQFYPMLNQGDLVNAMLNPEEGLPTLQRKVQIAEIGGASLAQNLTTSLNALDTRTNFANVMGGTMGAAEIAALGITKEEARVGYANVAEVLPRAEFLSSITGGEDYTQRQAEQEQFQGLASAKRAREALSATERGRFGGSAGTAGARSFASQTRGEI
jgi:hypothetical protein